MAVLINGDAVIETDLSGSYLPITQVEQITLPDTKNNTVDYDPLTSGIDWSVKIPVSLDIGDVTCTVAYDPSDTTHQMLDEHAVCSRGRFPCEVTRAVRRGLTMLSVSMPMRSSFPGEDSPGSTRSKSRGHTRGIFLFVMEADMKVRVLWCSPFGDKHKPGDVIDHPRAIKLVECGITAPLEPCGPPDESHRAEMFENSKRPTMTTHYKKTD